MSKAESFTNVCNSKTCFRVRRLAPEQKKRRTRKSFACFFNKASICHFGKIWRMGVCLPKQFRLLPPSRHPLAPSTSNPEKQLTSSHLPAFFADFTAVCRNKGRINEKIQGVLYRKMSVLSIKKNFLLIKSYFHLYNRKDGFHLE